MKPIHVHTTWALLLAALVAFLIYGANLLTAPPAAEEQPPMSFRIAGSGGNCSFCVWVAGEGRIAPSTVSAVEEHAHARHDAPDLFYLNSPGGDVEAAMAMGRIFRRIGAGIWVAGSEPERGVLTSSIETTVSGNCAGACILALLGAVERHGGYEEGTTVTFGPLASEIAQAARARGVRKDIYLATIVLPYLFEMGADARLLQRAYQRPGLDPLDEEELLELGIFLESGFERWTLAAESGSHTAQTRDRNLRERIQRLVLTCSSEGRVELTVTAHRSRALTDLKSTGTVVVRAGDDSWKFGRTEFTGLHGSDSTVVVQFPLPTETAFALATEEQFGVSFNVSNAAGHTLSEGRTTPEDRAVISQVTHSCKSKGQ